MDTNKRISLVIKSVLFILFVAGVTYITVKYASQITKLISSPEDIPKFAELIKSYGSTSALVYIFFQMLQIVIAIIPGEPIQMAGGYIFGTLLGTLYQVIGMLIGTVFVFYISRLLGYELINSLVPQDKIKKFTSLINNPKSDVTVFILFLIPGLPKDTLVYAAGFTPIKPLRFFIISSIGRLPGLIGSAYLGSQLKNENYSTVIVLSVIILIIFILGIVFRERIIDYTHKLMNKEKNM